MTSSIITVSNVSKAYRIGRKSDRADSFVGMLQEAVLAPFRNWKKMQAVDREESDEQDEVHWALRDVSFEVKEGDVVGIIGRNGAGKSTLLKILSRITEPTAGEVRIRGRVASLLEVGTGFHPELSGRENVYLNGTILGMNKYEIDRKFDEIVEFSGVKKFLDTPIKRYSSGMKVRLAFAVAAHLEQEILIVDEVLAVGDAEFQKRSLGKMQDVAKKGRTVLFVSHNFAIVESLCQKGIALQNGSIIYDGLVKDAVDIYENLDCWTSRACHTYSLPSPNPDSDLVMGDLKILNGTGFTSEFFYGDEIIFEVDFSSVEKIKSPLVGYLIRCDRGNRLVNGNNYFLTSENLDEPSCSVRVRCNLGRLPLMEGEYSVSLWVGRNANIQHYIEDAGRFAVKSRDIWGTGKLPTYRLSGLWWPTQFTIRDAKGEK